MSAIRGKDTGPEKVLWALCRWTSKPFTMNDPKLPGKPDAAFWQDRLAVFVHGCFWHGCPKHYRIPKSNIVFWDSKIVANKTRDLKAKNALEALGWNVLIVWECELSGALRLMGKIQNRREDDEKEREQAGSVWMDGEAGPGKGERA